MQLYIAWVTGFYYVMPHFVVHILCVKLVSRYTSWHGVFPMALFPDKWMGLLCKWPLRLVICYGWTHPTMLVSFALYNPDNPHCYASCAIPQYTYSVPLPLFRLWR